MLEFIKRGIIPIGAYCAPQCPRGELKNRVTPEQYRIAKDCGVDIMYGHSEVVGTPTEEYVFEALRCCEEVGIKYYVKDVIALEYLALEDSEKYKSYKDLTAEEKADLNARFEKSLKRYRDYAAFGGITFSDEPGYDSLDGIAEAKRVFEKVCPGKTFYVNMYPYYITPEQYQYGYFCNSAKLKADIEEFKIKEGVRNITRYEYLYDGFVKKVSPEFFSYDAYPFVILGSADTGVHEILWELPQFLHKKEENNGIPFAAFLQVGGKWEGMSNVRIPTEGEVNLGVSVPLLYGAKCLQLFPYMFPNDWYGDDAAYAGIVDSHGEKTKFFGYYKQAFGQVKAISKYLIGAKIKGVIKRGEYENGLPGKAEMQKIKWGECIYQGELPECGNIETAPEPPLKDIESEIQSLTGVLDIDGVNAYFAVNNSSTKANRTTLYFDGEHDLEVIRNAALTKVRGDKITLDLPAGCNALVICDRGEK